MVGFWHKSRLEKSFLCHLVLFFPRGGWWSDGRQLWYGHSEQLAGGAGATAAPRPPPLQHLGAAPRSLVSNKWVDCGVGDGVLGRHLVVSHGRVIEPLTPQDLAGHVRGSHLERRQVAFDYAKIAFLKNHFKCSCYLESFMDASK